MNDLIISERVDTQLKQEEDQLLRQIWQHRTTIEMFMQTNRRLEEHNEDLIEHNYQAK